MWGKMNAARQGTKLCLMSARPHMVLGMNVQLVTPIVATLFQLLSCFSHKGNCSLGVNQCTGEPSLHGSSPCESSRRFIFCACLRRFGWLKPERVPWFHASS